MGCISMKRKAKRILSRRAYAAHRGVSRMAVYKAEKHGRIAAACGPAGIDVDLADALWMQNTTRLPADPGAGLLADARLRKALASTLALAAEVEGLEGSLLRRDELAVLVPRLLDAVLTACHQHVLSRAGQVAGQDAAEVFAVLSDGVDAALAALYAVEVYVDPAAPQRLPLPDLSGLSAVEVAARRVELQARRIELQSEAASGQRIPRDQVDAKLVRAAGMMRRNMTALPAKLAPVLAATTDATLARKIIEAELDEIMQHELA
jgi:hypothetical protein